MDAKRRSSHRKKFSNPKTRDLGPGIAHFVTFNVDILESYGQTIDISCLKIKIVLKIVQYKLQLLATIEPT